MHNFQRGQPESAKITEMWYENHVYEHHRRERNEGNTKMSQIDWHKFRVDDDGSGLPEEGAVMPSVEEEDLYD
ncbi:hypothetical protein PG994_004136 [Apiospora phragmitis]|uniref:Uncharacterized protein n=1 Tax=Apiospora phragmitis TaxID=2905665 RepID=A0ABR1VQW4_9PEZI